LQRSGGAFEDFNMVFVDRRHSRTPTTARSGCATSPAANRSEFYTPGPGRRVTNGSHCDGRWLTWIERATSRTSG
jgi:hypothetical protein